MIHHAGVYARVQHLVINHKPKLNE